MSLITEKRQRNYSKLFLILVNCNKVTSTHESISLKSYQPFVSEQDGERSSIINITISTKKSQCDVDFFVMRCTNVSLINY